MYNFLFTVHNEVKSFKITLMYFVYVIVGKYDSHLNSDSSRKRKEGNIPIIISLLLHYEHLITYVTNNSKLFFFLPASEIIRKAPVN